MAAAWIGCLRGTIPSTDSSIKLKNTASSVFIVVTAYEEIMNILEEVETENKIPRGTLKQIYETEKGVVHLLSRENILDNLQGIVSDAANKIGG